MAVREAMGEDGFRDSKGSLECFVILGCCLRGGEMAIGRVRELLSYENETREFQAGYQKSCEACLLSNIW